MESGSSVISKLAKKMELLYLLDILCDTYFYYISLFFNVICYMIWYEVNNNNICSMKNKKIGSFMFNDCVYNSNNDILKTLNNKRL